MLPHTNLYRQHQNTSTTIPHSLEIMLSGNKRPRDADAIQDEELTKDQLLKQMWQQKTLYLTNNSWPKLNVMKVGTIN